MTPMELDRDAMLAARERVLHRYDNRLLLALVRLRIAMRPARGFPIRVYERLEPFGNRRRPFFDWTCHDGLRFVACMGDAYSRATLYEPWREDGLVRFIAEHRVGDGAILDVGANVGLVALRLARALPQCEVIAFEPVPDTIDRAAATFAMNPAPNSRLFQCAVGDVDGDISFYVVPESTDCSTSHPYDGLNRDTLQTIQVPCRRLDTLAAQGLVSGPVGFVKIDTEGHEFAVLKGARDVLARDRPGILFECNPDILPTAGWSPTEVLGYLRGIAPYNARVVENDGSISEFPPPDDLDHYVNIHCWVDR